MGTLFNQQELAFIRNSFTCTCTHVNVLAARVHFQYFCHYSEYYYNKMFDYNGEHTYLLMLVNLCNARLLSYGGALLSGSTRIAMCMRCM